MMIGTIYGPPRSAMSTTAVITICVNSTAAIELFGFYESCRYIDFPELKLDPEHLRKYELSRVMVPCIPKLRAGRRINSRHDILRFNPRYRYQFH